MLNNSYTQEQMIAEVNELLEFIYRKTRQEEPSDFDRLLYQLGSEYLRLISQKNEGCFKTSSLLNLPIGTRFFVTNGYWVGRVVLLDGVKHIYVEATRRVLRLTHEYAKSITAYIISEQKGDANMKCDCCKNTATYYAKSNGCLVFKCEDCLKDMSIANHDHLNWEYIQKDFYGGKQK